MTICRETCSPISILTSLSNSDHGLPLFLLLLLLLHTSSPASAQDATPPPPPPLEPFARLRFNKSMGIIFVILVVVFFVIGFISVYSRQCAERRFRGGNDLAIQIGGSTRGLDPEIIHAFPTFVYSSVKGLKIGRNTLECAVCLNEFQDHDTLRFIPKCSHVFHPDCIDLWLSSHSTCPVCRANLTPRPDDTSFVAVQIPDSALQPEPEEQHGGDEVILFDHNNANRVGDSGSSPKDRDINIIDLLNRNPSTNRSPAPRVWSTGFRFGSLFPRSHSTGHSLVSPGNNRERFTLRLPEEVRKELLSSTLNRTNSCGTLTSLRSERRGFRTRSVGGGEEGNYLQYERSGSEGRLDRWGFTWTPPFVGRSGSRKGSATEMRKAPVDGSEVAVEALGERSFDRLCAEREDSLN